MQKTIKKDLSTKEIRAQFAKLENVANTFAHEVAKLKAQQESFNGYMRSCNLFH